MTPIDVFCWDCGTPFAVSVSGITADDDLPCCPECESSRLGVDYPSLARRFGAGPHRACAQDDAHLDGLPAA